MGDAPATFRPVAFALLWASQILSMLASGMTTFALGVQVFQQRHAATPFALIALSAAVPALLAAPLAGACVDRRDRRQVMILSDLAAGLALLAVTGWVLTHGVTTLPVYALAAVSALAHAFRWPAFGALTAQMSPPELLGRTSGFLEAGQAVAMVLPPALAAMVLPVAGLRGLLLADLVSFGLALAVLLAVRTPSLPERAAETARSLLRDAADGWRYLRNQPGLFRLLLFFVAFNFALGYVEVLISPFVLSLAGPAALGAVMTAGGIGAVVGTAAMGIWGGPKRRIAGIMTLTGTQGLLLMVGGLHPTVGVIGVCTAGVLLAYPVVTGTNQALWAAVVPLPLQGRVFALQAVGGWAASPLAYLTAGPLADRVFEPLMAPGGAWAPVLGAVTGVGAGYGMALMVVALGLAMLLVTLAGYVHPAIRHIERQAVPAGPPPHAGLAGVAALIQEQSPP